MQRVGLLALLTVPASDAGELSAVRYVGVIIAWAVLVIAKLATMVPAGMTAPPSSS